MIVRRTGMVDDDTIFVSVASYRDQDCKNTIKSVFEEADNPTRVFVGTCEQNDPGDSGEACDVLTGQAHGSRIRTLRMHAAEARGPTYARYLCSTLWRGEKYFL